MAVHRAFAFTLRPRLGFQPEYDSQIEKFLEKFEGAKCVAEKTGLERHIHGQVFLDVGSTTGNFRNKLQRVFPPNQDNWNRRVAYNVRIAYNDSYIEEYMEKDNPEILFDHVPGDTKQYYPSEEEQQRAQKTANAKDPQLNHIEDLWWLEHVRSPLNVQEVNDWMFDQMFNARTIRTTNIRNMTCLFKRVFWYITKTDTDQREAYEQFSNAH